MIVVPFIINAVVSAAISMAVSWLFAPSVKGPRLKDTAATGQGYGPALPRVYGKASVGGSVIWASDLIERKKKSGGKGGGSQTSYSYSQHVAIAVCEGPAYILRIWAGGKLIWDATTGTAAKKIIHYDDVVTYTGADDQAVSSLVESYEGAGATSAYRGTCYVTLQGLQLAKFGNRLPPFQIEVSSVPYVANTVTTVDLYSRTYYSEGTAYTVTGLDAGDIIEVAHNTAGTYDGWSPWASDADPNAEGLPWTNYCRVESSGYGETYYATAAAASTAAAAAAPFQYTGVTSLKIWMPDASPSDNRGGLSLRITRKHSQAVDLADVVADICDAAGLSASEYDVTGLTGVVDGYVIPRPMSARDMLEPLRAAYWFDAAESEGVVKFVMRGASSVASIPEADLGANAGPDPAHDPFMVMRGNEEELPSQVDVHYIRKESEYEEGVQSERVMNTTSTALHSMDLAIVLSDVKARDVAAVTLYTTRLERTSYQFTATREYARIEPMDVVTVTYQGADYVIRITEKDEAGGIITFKGVAEDSSLYAGTATPGTVSGFYTASSAGTVGGVPPVIDTGATPDLSDIAPTTARFMDLPPILSTHSTLGIYVAASPNRAASTDEWDGALDYYSVDGGSTFIEGTELVADATLGTCSGTLGDYSGGDTLDMFNRLTVVVNSTDNELSSTTWTGLISGLNAAAIGTPANGWEIVQFQTATLVSSTSLTKTYTLSNLLRGRAGTEAAIGSHVASEYFVLLDEYIYRLGQPETQIGTMYYRVPSSGEDVDDVATQTVSNTGNCLKPYSPVNLRAFKSAAASWDILLTCNRRDRLHANSMLWAATLPMSEQTEAYELEIWDTTLTTLKRTVTGLSDPSYTYTNAMQVADFGSTQSAVGVKWYQVSATLGRGAAASQSLTVY